MKFKKISKLKFSLLEQRCPPGARFKWMDTGYKQYKINGQLRVGIYLPRDNTFYYI